MPPPILAFAMVWLLGLASWIAGVVCYLRARRYYVGPKGLLTFILPIGRLRPSNYSAAGPSLIRWQFRFMLIFLGTVLGGLAIAHFQFSGHQL